jgi:Hypervirulence associated proteins TUDOR domain
MGRRFREGEKVAWSSHGGGGVGVVERKCTSDISAAARMLHASEAPRYEVRSEKAGGTAGTNPGAEDGVR